MAPDAGRSRAILLAAAVLAASCGPSRDAPPAASGPPPVPEAVAPAPPRNVVLISIDTLRADRLAAYGHAPGLTPSLDALAARGATYLEARTAVPLTLPSHAVMMTGLLPPQLGARDNGDRVPPEPETLAEALRSKGYACAAFVGAAVLDRRFGLDQGFVVYDDEMPAGGEILLTPERRASAVVARAMAWLEHDAREPFFLFVHVFDPHAAYAAPEPFRSRHAEPYDAEVAYADHEVGRLLGYLRDRGVEDRTVAAVVADHGESLGEHGERTHGLFLYDATLRVPLVVAAPGQIPPGTRVSGPASLARLKATLLGLAAGVKAPGSLWPAPRGRTSDANAYAETLFPYLNFRWSGSQAIVAEGHKLVLSARPELYDLRRDPGEVASLLRDGASCAGPCESLRRRLDAALAEADAAGAPLAPGPDAETASTLRSLGYVSAGPGRPSGASRDERLRLPDPKDRIPQFARYDEAIVKLHARDYAGGMEILEGILAEDRRNVLALAFLGAAAFEAGDLPRARGAYERALAEAPARVDLVAQLARVDARDGRDEQALARAKAALAADASLTAAHLATWEVARRRGDAAAATAALEAAVDADPGNPALEIPLVEAYLAAGDQAGARAHLESVLTRSPGHARALTLRGVLRARAGDRDAALRDFEAAVAASPDSVQALVGLATAEAQAGHLARALEHYEKARAMSQDSPDLLNAMAFTCLQAGQRERARELLERSLEMAPEQPSARALLAQVGPRPRG